MCSRLPYTLCVASEPSTEAQHLSRPHTWPGSVVLAEREPNASLPVLTPSIPNITGCGLGPGHSFSWTEACSFCLADVPWHMLTEEVLSYVQEASSKPCDTGPVTRGCPVSLKSAYQSALRLWVSALHVHERDPSFINKVAANSLLQPRVHWEPTFLLIH